MTLVPSDPSHPSSLRIFSWNVNGLRSAARKGFVEVLAQSGADLFLLQESRAFPRDLPVVLQEPEGYHSCFFPAQKAGYSGVAVYVRHGLAGAVFKQGLGPEAFDAEGRWLECVLEEHRIVVITAYFPNAQREGLRLPYKLAFCHAALARLKDLQSQGWQVVLAGDINIAHQERDLANPKQNVTNPGFLPDERAWFDDLVGAGFVDTFRIFEPAGGHYSWWSARAGVRERNIGWRLDYHVVSPGLAGRVLSSTLHPGIMGSDHCPVSLDLRV
jgi:exodeoxyribonuclease-3